VFFNSSSFVNMRILHSLRDKDSIFCSAVLGVPSKHKSDKFPVSLRMYEKYFGSKVRLYFKLSW